MEEELSAKSQLEQCGSGAELNSSGGLRGARKHRTTENASVDWRKASNSPFQNSRADANEIGKRVK